MQVGRLFWVYAGTFVVVGWVLFLLSIPICFSAVVGTAISLTYFGASPQVPFYRYDNNACWILLACAAFASVASSIALASKLRALASALVIVIWSIVLAGIPVGRLFVKPGPDYFERHVGQEAFLVPWKYVPTFPGVPPERTPREDGFSASLCLSNLGGRGDAGCSSIQDVHVLPSENGGTDREIEAWRKYRSQMTPGPDLGGHKSFQLSIALPSGHQLVQNYFARLNPSGELTRLVVCRGNRETFCITHALVGGHWLEYQAGLAEGDEVLDDKLAALIESWRSK